ncbi:Ribosomal protein [Mycena venus]|uniref:Ribosomal protein n=1 Tax=Mycena venus TaxID=2733690 RepID=A0A8H6WYD9_9AGAR|nr:Ribosomal protein [Mycena venus]
MIERADVVSAAMITYPLPVIPNEVSAIVEVEDEGQDEVTRRTRSKSKHDQNKSFSFSSAMALRCSLARSLPLVRSLTPMAPRFSRPMSLQSDETTASQALNELGSDIFDTDLAEQETDYKPWMYLPPLASYGRKQNHEPLINVPTPEDPLLQFLTSLIMKHGERAKARRVVSKTLTYIFTLTRAPPLPIMREAVLLASPAVKTKSQTHGAKVVHVPMALSEKQRTHYGLMWLIATSKGRVGRRLEERLAREMVDIVQRAHALRDMPADTRPSGALGLKYDMHKFAMVNRGTVRIEPGAARNMAAAATASVMAPVGNVSSAPEAEEPAASPAPP